MNLRLRHIIAFAVLLGLLAGMVGCQGKEISVALKTYTATMDTLTAAREQGHISDKTQREVIAPAREAAKAILDEMVEAYVAGTPFDWRLALRRFYFAMAPLMRQQEVLNANPH